MPLTIEWITELGAFLALADQWEALLPKDAHPFDLHSWYVAWWAAFGGSSELSVCTVWGGGSLVAAYPLRRQGGRLLGFANDHSATCRPIARDSEAMGELLAAVANESTQGFELKGLPRGDSVTSGLEAAAHHRSMPTLTEPIYTCPYIDTRGDYETWRKESNSSWKGRLARYRRKMQRDHNAEFEIVAVPDNLEIWLEEGLRVEASGWKGDAGTAILSSPDTESFYRDIARRFHDRGELRLSRIALDGHAVAFSFCVLWANRLYSLKVGYDESRRKLVPGLVMQLSIVERCFELGLETYELLGETSDWKEKFATGNRPHVTLHAYPRRPMGLLRYAYRSRLRPRLKSAYRRVRPDSVPAAAN
jgi:CelD/BcsL family acetyltransferase involved in cellulose biosynthesis